jgi:hypothetical protein
MERFIDSGKEMSLTSTRFHADAQGLLGGRVDDVLEVGVDPVALGQQLVHGALADH